MTNVRVEPNPLIMLPFARCLFQSRSRHLILRHHWERQYHKFCLGLAAITSSYYVFVLHPGTRVLHATLEYVSFMVVVGSFFVMAGGIHLRVPGQERPALNTLFLVGGALLGNIIGTTGASMLLIPPWIAMNRDHFGGIHIAFFIFTVSNIGGALLPVGPPLFWTTRHRCPSSFGRHLFRRTNICRQRTEPARQGNRGAREDRDAELLRLRFQIRHTCARANFRPRLPLVFLEMSLAGCDSRSCWLIARQKEALAGDLCLPV